MSVNKNSRTNSQRSQPCLITNCLNGGRVLGRLGKTELTYCPKHRKTGERILNYLINSIFRYKLGLFLKESKQKIFMDNEPKLSEESYEKLSVFVKSMVDKIDGLEKEAKKNNISPVSTSDLD